MLWSYYCPVNNVWLSIGYLSFPSWSLISVVGAVASLYAGLSVVQFLLGEREFSLLQNVRIACGAESVLFNRHWGFYFPIFKWATHPNLMPRLRIVEISSAALCFLWHGLHDTALSSDFSGSVSSLELPVALCLRDHVVQLQVCLSHASTFLVFTPSLCSLSGTFHLLLAFLVSSTFSFSRLFCFIFPHVCL